MCLKKMKDRRIEGMGLEQRSRRIYYMDLQKFGYGIKMRY
jgi:hypothetical protein